jgi:phage terminase small subunit
VEHGLNLKQLNFALARLEGKTQREAYDLAGYTAKDRDAGASAIASNPKVAAFIEKHMQAAAEKALVTPEYVIERLRIESEGTGPDTSSSARTKATELLGKYLGMFTERQEVTMKSDIIVDLRVLPDAASPQ